MKLFLFLHNYHPLTGEILKNEYSKFDRRKPFEMGLGYYYQGDILLKPKTSKVGLLDPATRWPNGIVPYKYEGSFCKDFRMYDYYGIVNFFL